MFLFNSIRGRILAGIFILLSVTIISLTVVNNIYFKKRALLADLAFNVQETNTSLYRLVNISYQLQSDYIEGSYDVNLYNQQLLLLDNIRIKMSNLDKATGAANIDINRSVEALIKELYLYSLTCVNIDKAYIDNMPNDSLKKEFQKIRYITNDIESYINAISAKVYFEKNSSQHHLRLLYFIITFALTGLGIISSIYLSKAVTKSLELLSNHISEFALNKFKKPVSLNLKNSSSEVENINTSFNHLLDVLLKHENQRDMALKNLEIERFRYMQLTEMLPISIFETDKDFNLVYYNKAFRTKMKLPSKHTLYNFKEFIPSSEKFEAIKCLNCTEGMELEIKKSDNNVFIGMIFIDTINLGELVGGKRGIIVDISKKIRYIEALRREKKRAEISDNLKSAFLANMSHEIRTPMNGIIGFSDLLSQEDCAFEHRKIYLEQITRCSENLLKLIDDILDFAKLESGVINIEKKIVCISDLLNEIKEYYNTLILSSNPDVNFVLSVKMPHDTLIVTDPVRLKQIIVNLMNNAIKIYG